MRISVVRGIVSRILAYGVLGICSVYVGSSVLTVCSVCSV